MNLIIFFSFKSEFLQYILKLYEILYICSPISEQNKLRYFKLKY